jgi:hypothetical protein
MRRECPFSQEYLKSVLSYDKMTGLFTWKYRENVPPEVNTRWAGKLAGKITDDYVSICVDGQLFGAHVLAWFYVTGEWPETVDHKNLKHNDNKFKNLRAASYGQQNVNRRIRKDNKSGHKGVRWRESRHSWQVRITINSKEINLGSYKNYDEACAVFDKVYKETWGEFARLY